MGCGKSSVGRRLSELLGWRFMDLDELIERHECKTILEIFAKKGEGGFRTIEAKMLEMIINEHSSSTDGNLVLSLGGGTVMTPECARLIHEHTHCIYLRADVDTLVDRLARESAVRPMLQSPSGSTQHSAEALRKRITGLMALRSSTYESVAHQIIGTDGKSIEDILNDIAPKHKVESAYNK